MPTKVRTNIYITNEQHFDYADLARTTGISASEHVRRALDAYLAGRQRQARFGLRPNPPLVDADGSIHATLTAIEPDVVHYDDYDIHRIVWTFTAPGLRKPLEHRLWSSHTPDYHPMPGIRYLPSPEAHHPNVLARLLLIFDVVTVEDFVTQRAGLIIEEYDLDTLLGTAVTYQLGPVYDPFSPPAAGDPTPRWGETTEGPDLDTMTLDPTVPRTPQPPEKETSV